jgi:hypothetical protein
VVVQPRWVVWKAWDQGGGVLKYRHLAGGVVEQVVWAGETTVGRVEGVGPGGGILKYRHLAGGVVEQVLCVRYHSGGSMKLNARILFLAHMVYL